MSQESACWPALGWSNRGGTPSSAPAHALIIHVIHPAVPVAGGSPHIAVNFDDPTRPWHRFGFRVRGNRFYFTLGDVQSDIWVTELAR